MLVIIICGKVTRRDCFFHPRSLQSNKLLYRRLQQRKLLCVSLFSESRMLRRKRKRNSTECRRSPSVSVCQPYTNNCAVNCLILTSAFCLTVPRRCISSDVGMTCFGYCDFSASAHAIWSLSYTQATWEKTGTRYVISERGSCCTWRKEMNTATTPNKKQPRLTQPSTTTRCWKSQRQQT